MESPERFNLRWEDFGANARVALKELREESEFLDVTLLAGDGKRVQVSKVVLAAGSSFFLKILRENPHPHPLIYLKGVNYKHLLSVSDFLYTGEASIAEQDVDQFLEIAQDLKIKGLIPTQNKSGRTTPDPHENQVAIEKSAPIPRMDKHPHSEISPRDPVAVKEFSPAPSSSLPPSARSLPPHGRGTAEDPGLSHEISHPHGALSPPQDPVAIEDIAPTPWIPHPPGAMYHPLQGQMTEQEPAPVLGVSSSQSFASPPQDHVAIEETAPTPWIPHPPGTMYHHLQGQVTEQEPARVPRVSSSQSFASPHGQSSVPQSAYEEDNGGKFNVKVEVGDASHGEAYRKHNSKNKDIGLVTNQKQNEQAIFSGKEPKEETMDASSDMVISEATDSVFENNQIHDWYRRDEQSRMALAGEQDQNIQLDITHFEDKEENSIYEVACKESLGEFHHEKFVSGGMGLCILSNGIWMTPNEFERRAGSRAKKYKQSLRVNGKPIGNLILYNEVKGNYINTPTDEGNIDDVKVMDVSNLKDKKRKKQFNKGNNTRNRNSKKIQLDKMYEYNVKNAHTLSVGASSTLENDQDEFLNTADDITSENEIDLSGTPVFLALHDNTANLDESYIENIAMKDRTLNLDESYTKDAVVIDLDFPDNYRSPIVSKTKIKLITDNDVSEIVDLEQLNKEKNSSNGSTDVSQFDTTKLDDKFPKPDVKRDKARFSDSQTSGLRKAFSENNFLSNEKAQLLSQELCITEKQIRTWFSNSRREEKILVENLKYSCEICSRSFVNKSKFTKHMSSHDSGAFQKDKTNDSNVRNDGTA